LDSSEGTSRLGSFSCRQKSIAPIQNKVEAFVPAVILNSPASLLPAARGTSFGRSSASLRPMKLFFTCSASLTSPRITKPILLLSVFKHRSNTFCPKVPAHGNFHRLFVSLPRNILVLFTTFLESRYALAQFDNIRFDMWSLFGKRF
jgi:hypothetical protein